MSHSLIMTLIVDSVRRRTPQPCGRPTDLVRPAYGGCGKDAMNVDDNPDAFGRLPTGQRMTLDRRLCKCPSSALRPNESGIQLLTTYPEWAGQDVLKALAVCEGTDLAVIDTSRAPADRTQVYPADGERQAVFISWASVLVPRLRKQQAGLDLGMAPDGRRSRVMRPVRPLRVLLYDGALHYDATRRVCAQ